jgi:catechol 2,3-dioxygenase-like lactoylglutathione lyase family enzyme
MRRSNAFASLTALMLAWCAADAAQGAPADVPENPLGLQVHHVTASVLDIDRATRWYQQVLGFKLVDQGTRNNGAFRFAELRIPGFGIGLVQIGSQEALPPGKSTPAPAWLHVVFAVADPSKLFQELHRRGADVFQRAGVRQDPITSFLMHDSEGNEIEIVARSDQ